MGATPEEREDIRTVGQVFWPRARGQNVSGSVEAHQPGLVDDTAVPALALGKVDIQRTVPRPLPSGSRTRAEPYVPLAARLANPYRLEHQGKVDDLWRTHAGGTNLQHARAANVQVTPG